MTENTSINEKNILKSKTMGVESIALVPVAGWILGRNKIIQLSSAKFLMEELNINVG